MFFYKMEQLCKIRLKCGLIDTYLLKNEIELVYSVFYETDLIKS